MQIENAYQVFMTHGAAERLYASETLKKHQDVFRSWLAPYFQGREVESISRRDILEFRAQFIAKGIGVYRQYQIIMTLKLFLKFCRNILQCDCLDPAEVSLPRRKAPKVEYLTSEEIARVREACNIRTFTGMRLRVLIEVLLATGLRISEALALDREPFDNGARELEIRGKNGKKRVIFFTEEALRWIALMLKLRTDHQPQVFATTGTPPRRLCRADISKQFVELRRKAEIKKKLTPHMLRHTYCTSLLNNGADITHIKELAGHSDIQTTARYYLGVDRDALRKIVAKYVKYPDPERTALTSQ